MSTIRYSKTIRHLSIITIWAATLVSCTPSYEETNLKLDQYQTVDNLHLSAIAAEPLIEAPVDISFDNKGRLWVLEMQGYMRTLEGIDEEAPVGRIVVMEDLDADGKADHTKVFLDSLKLARALTHVYRGLLYAEPPNLWFVEIKNDLTPGKRTLVDSAYATGGNVEHQPNGLLVNLDNWIYNAKSSKRYRRVNGFWETQQTAFRGQWGISKDAYGRLIYNHNSSQVRGDHVLPNLLYKPGYQSDLVINTTVVNDQRVYPLQATAVNRGYIPGMLHEDDKLVNFTSACGPVYLQGSSFTDDYQSNVFVCAPEANLIKRNVLAQNAFSLTGKQAWVDQEFIASTDLGFRPVNLKNGPDGALYIVDMHRGIIQHSTYMTSYLREQYIQRGLDSLMGMGRVLRATQNDTKWKEIDLTIYPLNQLIDSLESSNVWIRDRVQQMIVYSGDQSLTTPLVELLNSSENEIARIHAFYCLEGLQTLSKNQLNINNMLHHPRLLAHVMKLMGENRLRLTNQALDKLYAQNDSTIDYYSAFLLAKNFNSSAITYLTQLLDRYDQSLWILEPIAIALEDDLTQFHEATNGYDRSLNFIDSVQDLSEQTSYSPIIGEDHLTKGLGLYRRHCATCHRPDGKGIPDLAPPLLASEYVAGPSQRLVDILMYGLEGPITVAGTTYDFITAMPGLKSNEKISDEDIKLIANYVRNAFTTSPQTITREMVLDSRKANRAADKMYTGHELNEKYQNL